MKSLPSGLWKTDALFEQPGGSRTTAAWTATGPRSQRPTPRAQPNTSPTRGPQAHPLRAGTSRGPARPRFVCVGDSSALPLRRCAVSLGLAFLAFLSADAATFTVTSVLDSGSGSLRQAILDANHNPGSDEILFQVPTNGVVTISLLTDLPAITDPVVCDGYTQPGSQTNSLSEGSDACILIRLDGRKTTGFIQAGLRLQASHCLIRGLCIVNCGRGLQLEGGQNCVIAGNWIGLDVDNLPSPNLFEGIHVMGDAYQTATRHRIGGSAPGDRNVISGNGSGVVFFGDTAAENHVLGNFIGTDVTGTLDLGNQCEGVAVQRATGTIIGGALPEAGNLVSNKQTSGIQLFGADDCVIEGNIVGTDRLGQRPLGNREHGIQISGNRNRVGGTNDGAGNRVLFSGKASVAIEFGPNNLVRGNVLLGQRGLAIDLSPPGLMPNDPFDPDSGANELRNRPVLSTADVSASGLRLVGLLESAPHSAFRLDLYAAESTTITGQAQAAVFLGSTRVVTDGSGTVALDILLSFVVTPGSLVSAVAIDDFNNVSELSEPVLVAGQAPAPALTLLRAGRDLLLRWPSAALGYELQQTAGLEPQARWMPVPWPVETMGAVRLCRIPPEAVQGENYFRLAHP